MSMKAEMNFCGLFNIQMWNEKNGKNRVIRLVGIFLLRFTVCGRRPFPCIPHCLAAPSSWRAAHTFNTIYYSPVRRAERNSINVKSDAIARSLARGKCVGEGDIRTYQRINFGREDSLASNRFL